MRYLLFLFIPFTLFSQEILFWHAFDGYLEEVFTEIVETYNQSNDGTIKLIKKKSYQTLVDEGFETKTPPHILQVSEVPTLSAMLKKGMFVSVESLMKVHSFPFNKDDFIDVAKRFYSSPSNEMFSLPWNASTGILFYNKEAFKKAGLDPEKVPKTWEELLPLFEPLKNAGYTAFTTAWPAAYHLEHQACLHNIPFATLRNGFDGIASRLVFNSEKMVHHLQSVFEWQKRGYFAYYGRFSEEPEKQFTCGNCAILLQGANRYGNLKKSAVFDIGVSTLPYWHSKAEKPYSLNIGGSSFWVFEGFSDSEYESIAKFLSYLSKPEVQALWHQKTGYLPISKSAFESTQKLDFYKENPSVYIAVEEVLLRPIGDYSSGVRLGDYLTIRNLIIDKLELCFNGTLTPQEALDQAVTEGNKLLDQFEFHERNI